MADQGYEGVGDVYERLHGDARTHPIPEYVMEVTTKEGLEEARKLLNYAIDAKITTGAELSRRTGIKPSAISDFKKNKWGKRKAGLEATVASDLAKAINAIIREQQARETEIRGFVPIRLAEAIFDVVEYAKKRCRIVVIAVPAGSGKTITLNALEIETPGAVLITVKRARSTVKSFLQLWARALGINEAGRTEDIQDRISTALADSRRLILIDEAHKLSIAALDAIREIWDDARVPIVMAATPSLYQTITSRRVGTQQAELMDQLFSRIGIFRDLTTLPNPRTGEPEKRVNLQDVRKLFARGKVRLAPEATDFLCKLANTPGAGGLRVCCDLVQMVIDLWPGEIITVRLLGEALETRLGVKEAGFRMDSAEIVQPAAAAG